MTRTVRSVETEVLAALATVMDPELDEPVTELGFVRSVTIDDRGVEAHLRLPTSFCAPNFAYLMVADAYDALAEVPGRPHLPDRRRRHQPGGNRLVHRS